MISQKIVQQELGRKGGVRFGDDKKMRLSKAKSDIYRIIRDLAKQSGEIDGVYDDVEKYANPTLLKNLASLISEIARVNFALKKIADEFERQ